MPSSSKLTNSPPTVLSVSFVTIVLMMKILMRCLTCFIDFILLLAIIIPVHGFILALIRFRALVPFHFKGLFGVWRGIILGLWWFFVIMKGIFRVRIFISFVLKI